MKNKKTKRILIATGIYPPDIGGPAQYAYGLERLWKGEGYNVTVKYFGFERKLPTGIRHIFYFCKSIPSILMADYILVLDTWSAALPITIGAMILRKRFVIRTGGDFLWESYVERTKEKILLKDFYKYKRNFTSKEALILKVTKWILKKANKIVFSTDWQRQIWSTTYHLQAGQTDIVENYFGEKIASSEPNGKVFVGATRPLVWKNIDTLKDAFLDKAVKNAGAVLDMRASDHRLFIERMQRSYAVILLSLGDISPNMILDSISCGKPFIVTKEIGIYDRIKDIGIFVDPLNLDDIAEKIIWLCEEDNYKKQKALVDGFSFRHSWQQIGEELLQLYQ
jgi:glycosyltransferase involved in cell wall biosynthesis